MTSWSRWAEGAARVLGFALLLPVGILYLSSGLVVPVPWVFALWLLWVAFAVYAVRARARPWRVLATPVAAVVAWMVVVSLGDAFLGWTA